ncbi:hypothetical protein F4811DRAFT_60296 [Daldinia bambusicola]|nr:hypothetical protein F4811DRAFT_60296 [Daldinia bambusicola]
MNEQHLPSFAKPDHIFIRSKAYPRLSNLEFAACKSLFNTITDLIRHSQGCSQKDVKTFCILSYHIRPEMRWHIIISHVIFDGIIAQIAAPSFSADVWSPLVVLFDLLSAIMNPALKLPPSISQPLSKKDVIWGLLHIYNSPEVRPRQNKCATLNFHFHHFASSMYASDAMDNPIFFVWAMRDALETSWNRAERYNELLNSVWQWIMSCGDKILGKMKKGFEEVSFPMGLFHGHLYELDLNSTYGDRHPAPGLTMHRWQF